MSRNKETELLQIRMQLVQRIHAWVKANFVGNVVSVTADRGTTILRWEPVRGVTVDGIDLIQCEAQKLQNVIVLLPSLLKQSKEAYSAQASVLKKAADLMEELEITYAQEA